MRLWWHLVATEVNEASGNDRKRLAGTHICSAYECADADVVGTTRFCYSCSSMAFIRRKVTAAGTPVYGVVRTSRKGDCVRQQMVAYLGRYPTPSAAIAALLEQMRKWRTNATAARREAAQMHRWVLARRPKMPPRPSKRQKGTEAQFLRHYYGLLDRADRLHARIAEAQERIDEMMPYRSLRTNRTRN